MHQAWTFYTRPSFKLTAQDSLKASGMAPRLATSLQQPDDDIISESAASALVLAAQMASPARQQASAAAANARRGAMPPMRLQAADVLHGSPRWARVPRSASKATHGQSVRALDHSKHTPSQRGLPYPAVQGQPWQQLPAPDPAATETRTLSRTARGADASYSLRPQSRLRAASTPRLVYYGGPILHQVVV